MYKIQIHNNEDLFLKYLVNTSKLHWRVESEGVDEFDAEGKRLPGKRNVLTEQEKQDHTQNLINKIFTIGYLLHRHRSKAHAWAVYSMDHEINDVSESHGGTGKSLLFTSLAPLMPKMVVRNGRVADFTKDKNVFADVTDRTGIYLVNDCNRFLDYHFFYDPITEGIEVRQLYMPMYKVPFDQSPKIVFTSNYGMRGNNSSWDRRIIYNVNSDYYHHHSEKNETARTPYDEFGKNLVSDFTPDEMNSFYNLMAQAIVFKMRATEKIEPPSENIHARNAMSDMHESFGEWADIYFNEPANKLNNDEDDGRGAFYDKKEAVKHFNEHIGGKSITAQKFMQSLKAWCKINHYTANPTHMLNKQGRLQRKIDGHTIDVIYIHTPKPEAATVTSKIVREVDGEF